MKRPYPQSWATYRPYRRGGGRSLDQRPGPRLAATTAEGTIQAVVGGVASAVDNNSITGVGAFTGGGVGGGPNLQFASTGGLENPQNVTYNLQKGEWLGNAIIETLTKALGIPVQ